MLPYRDRGYGSYSTLLVDSNVAYGANNTFTVCNIDVPTTGMVYNSIPNPHQGSLFAYLGNNLKVLSCPATGAPPISDPANKWGTKFGVDIGASPFYTKFFINYMMFWGQPTPTTSTVGTPDFRAFINGYRQTIGGNSYPAFMPNRITLGSQLGNPQPAACPLMQDAAYANFTPSKYYSGSVNPNYYNQVNDPITFAQGNHLMGGGGFGSSTTGYNGFVAAYSTNPSDSTGFVSTASNGRKFPSVVDGGNILYWDGHVDWLKSSNMQDAGWPEDNVAATRHTMSDAGPWHN